MTPSNPNQREEANIRNSNILAQWVETKLRCPGNVCTTWTCCRHSSELQQAVASLNWPHTRGWSYLPKLEDPCKYSLSDQQIFMRPGLHLRQMQMTTRTEKERNEFGTENKMKKKANQKTENNQRKQEIELARDMTWWIHDDRNQARAPTYIPMEKPGKWLEQYTITQQYERNRNINAPDHRWNERERASGA